MCLVGGALAYGVRDETINFYFIKIKINNSNT